MFRVIVIEENETHLMPIPYFSTIFTAFDIIKQTEINAPKLLRYMKVYIS
jgi:hypothetical protein